MWKKIIETLAAIGGAIASFFCGLPPIIWVLLAVMSLDYITGIICGLMGKSPKTANGGLESRAAFLGLLKNIIFCNFMVFGKENKKTGAFGSQRLSIIFN